MPSFLINQRKLIIEGDISLLFQCERLITFGALGHLERGEMK